MNLWEKHKPLLILAGPTPGGKNRTPQLRFFALSPL